MSGEVKKLNDNTFQHFLNICFMEACNKEL